MRRQTKQRILGVCALLAVVAMTLWMTPEIAYAKEPAMPAYTTSVAVTVNVRNGHESDFRPQEEIDEKNPVPDTFYQPNEHHLVWALVIPVLVVFVLLYDKLHHHSHKHKH